MPKPILHQQFKVVPDRAHWASEAEHGFHNVDSTRRTVRYVNGYGFTVEIATVGANVSRAVMAEKRAIGFEPSCDPPLPEDEGKKVVQ